MENLIIVLIHFTFRGIVIKYKLLPCCLDSKGRVLFKCMYDEKTQSMGACVNCGAGPAEMGDPCAACEADPATYKYGLSPSHARVKGMEWMCKTYLYKDVKSWSFPRGMTHLKKDRMPELQEQMKEKIGVDVYKVRPGSIGNSNCGNTSRRAFEQAEVFANIVGFPTDLAVDLGIMLNAINSKEDINPRKFKCLADDFLERFGKSEVRWNWPNPGIHGMIKHGDKIIEELPTAPGRQIAFAPICVYLLQSSIAFSCKPFLPLVLLRNPLLFIAILC